MKRAGFLVACAIAAVLWRPAEASAQTEARVLMLDDFMHVSNYFTGVWCGLGRRPDRYTESFVSFMEYLQDQEWDYVVFVYYSLRSPEEHAALAEALEEHLARGGTLAFTYPHLDEAAELWEVLGVASADDPPEPEEVHPTTDPRHPIWLETGAIGTALPLLWIDFGDVLEPASGSVVVGMFAKSGLPAVLESRGGQVIVNGVEWDDYGPADLVGRDQTWYLTTCVPDFNRDGVLDFFDFLDYQMAFAAGDPRADLNCSGGTLSFFDFLIFQDAFTLGCGPAR
jgi:hypothetical protein